MIDLDELERLCREATPGPWDGDTNLDLPENGRLSEALRNAAPELIAMARRYQWLRDEAKKAELIFRRGADLDAAIDAAMQEKP